jgi:hypothetical protein
VTVSFCTAGNTVVPMVVSNAWSRREGAYDYTVLIFTNDLPTSISAMQVSTNYPTTKTVLHVASSASGEVIPAGPYCLNYEPNCNCRWPWNSPTPWWLPPFNNDPINCQGDSGSPNMLLASDGTLVFLSGSTTSGPCEQMKADMATLSTLSSLNPANYQWTVHPPY